MLNLLNTIVLFGKEFEWPLENALFWLLIAQVALILFIVIVFAVLIKRVGKSEVVVDTKPEERGLQGITLDTSMAQRDFAVGEDFNCDGLAVTAIFNLDPVSEPVHVISVITHEQFDSLQKSGQMDECYIVRPDTSKEGKIAVTVNYRGKQAMYYVAVGQQKEQPTVSYVTAFAEPQPVAERTLTGLTLDLGVVRREFTVGDDFDCDGLVIKANYSLDPREEIITDHTLIDKAVFDGIASEALNGCYVIKPDMSSEGKVAVDIRYKDRSAVYMVVVKAAEEEPIAEEEPEKTAPVRSLIDIALDLGIVQREFTLGDDFNCDGLIVNAEYDADPRKECLAEYTIISENGFADLSDEEKATGCYVIAPDLSVAGKKAVEVRYNGQTALYSIAVSEPACEEETPAEEPVEELVEEPVEEPAEEPAEEPVRTLVGISVDVRVVPREFTVGDEFDCEGLLITANYDSDPMTESLIEYSLLTEEEYAALSEDEMEGLYVIKPDMSEAGKRAVTIHYGKFTAYYTISVDEAEEEPAPERTLLYISVNTDNVRKDFTAGDAFDCNGLVVTAHFNTEPLETDIDDYSIVAPDMSKEGTAAVSILYQDRTVGYRVNIAPAPVREVAADEEPDDDGTRGKSKKYDLGDEETHEAGVLRYDKSFTARFIQSSDEIKTWYTKLKNELLSYKKIKARMSWKRETYRYGRETVARLGYRGNTLCIFLPLNPADYVDSKYKVEDVSDSPSYIDTPCMYRLKNERRVRLAMELFATVMERMGVPRIERISEDYYLPYEGIVELIDRGLAKRVIKDKADEAIFLQNASSEKEDKAPASANELPDEEPHVEEQSQQLPDEEPQAQEPSAEESVTEEEAQAQETSIEETEQPAAEITEPAAETQLTAEEETPADENANETTADEATDETSAERPATNETSEEGPAEDEASYEEAAVDETADEEAAVEETSDEEAAAEETLDEEATAEETLDEEAAADEAADDETAADEAADDETAEQDGEVDFSSGLSSEKHRFNGKNRKKHRVRK